ncbi:Arginine exporter protein ArgO [Pseudomonas chlororaphis subsp. aurantiaca]|nr:Arginine exporter protein ArgO [Pseudomonas chlororaphis subsp. aurantiaca]
MWQSYVNGLLVAAGLIMAIGSQNAFVLAQSLRREHHLPVAVLCVTCDALLVAAGVFGLATVLAQSPTLLAVARWGGAAFLIWYGSQALRRACSKQSLQQGENQTVRSLRAVLLSALAVTLLNPHVYLDTVLLIGSLGHNRPNPAPMWSARPALRCCGFSPWPSAPRGWLHGWHGRAPGAFSTCWWR